MASRGAEVALMSGLKGRKKGGERKAKTTELHIRRAKNKGYIVRHTRSYGNGMPAPDEEHVVPDSEELHDHIEQHMGDAPPEPGTPPPDDEEDAPAQEGSDAQG